MQNRITIFSDIESLKKLKKLLGRETLNDIILESLLSETQSNNFADTKHKMQVATFFQSFGTKRIYILSDKKKFDEENEKSNYELNQISKKITQDIGKRIGDFDETLPLPKQVTSFSFFLLEKSNEECQNLTKKHGILFINVDNMLLDFQHTGFWFKSMLFNIDPIMPKHNAFEDWESLRDYKHFCNEMVIIDNYFFGGNFEGKKDYEYVIKKNTIPMLKNILHNEKLDKGFKLVVFVGYEEKYTRNPNLPSEIYNFFVEEIKNENFKFSIKLYLINVEPTNRYTEIREKLKIHDRNIFTNYFWLHSGHSFTYLNEDEEEKVNKSTNLVIQSIFSDSYDTNNNAILESLKIHVNKVCNFLRLNLSDLGYPNNTPQQIFNITKKSDINFDLTKIFDIPIQ